MRILSIIAGAVFAVSGSAALAQDVERGGEYYRTNCATCHGIEATGQGPMAGVLVIKPADLTRLAADNGGVFPLRRVIRRIDGRDPLVSHGSPMPIFGQFFEGRDVVLKAPDGQPIITSEPIADLIAYLETLQVH